MSALQAATLDDEISLATRAAWLYFAGGMTQGEIATRLSIPSAKAHRLISRATREGLVRVFVEGPVAECIALEESLCAKFGLRYCHVSPNLDENGLPLKTLGMAGATFLRGRLERGGPVVIGVGHGRTIAAAVAHLPGGTYPEARFVSLLGGLTRKFSASPFDVIHRLAERTGGEAYVLPVPIFADSAADRAVMVSQFGVRQVFELGATAELMFAGIGEARVHGSLVTAGLVRSDEVVELESRGVEGEILGHFVDGDGRRVETELSARSITLDFETLHRANIVAIAGGPTKVTGMRAVLRSGLVKGLITDEATAVRLVEETGAQAPQRERLQAAGNG